VRERFLAHLSDQLGARVDALEATSRRGSLAEARSSILDLRAFVRELQVIAAPARPVPMRPRRRELGGLIADSLTELHQRADSAGYALELAQPGRVLGRFDPHHLGTRVSAIVTLPCEPARGLCLGAVARPQFT
jgi:hypothetical protein